MESLAKLRPLILLGCGLMGLSGVALAAAASHGGDTHFLGDRLFPFAAPTGGTLMMLGWLLVAAGGFLGRRT